MGAMRVVFVHGTGRSGALAWPGQATAVDLRRWDCRFPDLAPFDDPDDEVRVVLDALGVLEDGHGHLVAHSAGAVAALRAAERTPDRVRSLVLLEPAAFSAARGGPHVEEHVRQMGEVVAAAADPRVRDGDVAIRFLTALGAPGAAIADPADPALRSFGRRIRRRTPPWAVPVDPSVVGRVPTLVVTGGWSALYDEVADALAASGATRLVLPGYGHRPQDHPDANAALQAHWRAHEG